MGIEVLAAGGDIMYKNIKRLMDIILSIIGIVICAVPMLIVAVIIKLDSPGPVFFSAGQAGAAWQRVQNPEI